MAYNRGSPTQLMVAEKIASRPLILLALCACIIAIGILLTVVGYCTSLQRSGAVLVCVAVFAVYLNHFVATELVQDRRIYSMLKQYQDKNHAADSLLRQNENLSPNEIEHVAVQLSQYKQQKIESMPKLQTLSSNIITLEFSAGIAGTLIWAFGDLVCEPCFIDFLLHIKSLFTTLISRIFDPLIVWFMT